MPRAVPDSVDATLELLEAGAYVADRPLATVVFLTLQMERPLLLEGETGVGKTEIANVLAKGLGRKLVRLSCHDGLDLASAVYEWNYPAQMLALQSVRKDDDPPNLYTEQFLVRRPLLEALAAHEGAPPVLLIDEVDRADAPFEALLLELLSEFRVTIPEFGTIAAANPPPVVLTSNRTREIHDALKRRCLYHWVGYPDAAREFEILRVRQPDAPPALAQEVVAFVRELRSADLFKPPGTAETLDWAHALIALDCARLEDDTIDRTLGVLLKYQDDIDQIRGSEAARLLSEAHRKAA